ncbi:MAG TPA: ParM/StbA family protein [Thermoplasmataceae archaeon]|nr:ParM/StbA family protein [Thermoplasmatales archaeon AK]HLH86668.1 ParM/StbA family protein [Thermoplasmataceae archaeon]
MIVLGVDLGYGDTKVVGEDGQREKFPSRWAATEAKNWGMGGTSTILSVNGSEPFFFGEDATGANVREPQGDGRLSDPDSLPLLAGALWVSGVGKDGKEVEIVLGSGTPLGTFEHEVNAAKEFLQGKEIEVKHISGEVRKFKISKLVMRPQGVGAALYLLDKGMLKTQYGYGVVVDIGSRTTDVLTVNLKNMEPVVEMSFSIQAGVGDIVAGISKTIAKETGFIVPTDVAREAISQTVIFKQREVGGPRVSEPIMANLANRILDKLRENLREELDRITALIPVGGGSNLIGNRLEALAPGTLIKIPSEDIQFANALGYRDAAARTLKN